MAVLHRPKSESHTSLIPKIATTPSARLLLAVTLEKFFHLSSWRCDGACMLSLVGFGFVWYFEDTFLDEADCEILDANRSFRPQHIVGVPTELTEENERLAAALPVEP
jgi:hypothetical protein